MKVVNIGLTFLAGALLVAAGAFAGEANKATLRLQEKVTVEGKQLSPGTYRLEWDGTGPDVRVNILRGKETVATVPAHLVEQQARNAQDGYGTTAEADGSKSLASVYVAGKHFILQLQGSEAAQHSGSQQSPK
jgi:hypothetical protein